MKVPTFIDCMASNTSNHTSTTPRKVNGMILRDHRFQLPLDYTLPQRETIEIFAREVCLREKDGDKDLPWMIYFQGGPGFASPRPSLMDGWIGEALKSHRLLLLDDRGTGLSSRILPQSLVRFATPGEQAAYLVHFRADNIVRDAEAIREVLLGPNSQWVGIGQSYGGFCLLTYLSLHPESLSGVIITGGVAGIKSNIDDIYRLTYQRVIEKNEGYYRRYPEDEELAKRIVTHLAANEISLPGGAQLTPRRFQQLGLPLGMSDGRETLHYLLETAFIDGSNGPELSFDFLKAVENQTSFETNPIFCLLHEAVYAEGYASRWAAERLREEFPEVKTEGNDRFVFTGEMIAPSMLDDYSELTPLKECAEILAENDENGVAAVDGMDEHEAAAADVPGAGIGDGHREGGGDGGIHGVAALFHDGGADVRGVWRAGGDNAVSAGGVSSIVGESRSSQGKGNKDGESFHLGTNFWMRLLLTSAT